MLTVAHTGVSRNEEPPCKYSRIAHVLAFFCPFTHPSQATQRGTSNHRDIGRVQNRFPSTFSTCNIPWDFAVVSLRKISQSYFSITPGNYQRYWVYYRSTGTTVKTTLRLCQILLKIVCLVGLKLPQSRLTPTPR